MPQVRDVDALFGLLALASGPTSIVNLSAEHYRSESTVRISKHRVSALR